MSHTYDLAILSHHKCATNWLRAICRELQNHRLATVDVLPKQLAKAPAPRGGIAIILHVNAVHRAKNYIDYDAQPMVHFVRDPRDALVSNYWSWLRSHENNNDTILSFRERAVDMSVEEGLLALMDIFPMAVQLETWTDAMWQTVTTVKYEDMLADFDGTLTGMMAVGGLRIPPKTVATIRQATDFKTITGRKAGDERVDNHFRKGIAGDWENVFTPAVTQAFHDRHGWLGERLGYW